MVSFFGKTFENIHTPVIVCFYDKAGKYPLAFANSSAKILLNPLMTAQSLREEKQAEVLGDFLRFEKSETFGIIEATLLSLGAVSQFSANIINFENKIIPVSISANDVEFEGKKYVIFYVYETKGEPIGGAFDTSDTNNVMAAIFHAAYHTADANEAINKILSITGKYVHASRVYVFEDLKNGYTRNTYEWCDKGIKPAIQDLQHLKKEDYNYDAIVSDAMYITDDVRNLPKQDREILEAQGIKSLAILPLFYVNEAIGYVGFDDCVKYRKWSRSEIQMLRQILNVILSLIERRNAEEKAGRSLEILRTISDNIDNVIYACDIHTYEIVFANNTLAETLNMKAEDMLGRLCWQTLQKDMNGPCEFCPIPKMVDGAGNIMHDRYTWEFQNTTNGKWYLVRDAIIKWIDGRYVHIETAIDITGQKKHEEQLRYFASMDTMTGTYNREWGYKIINGMIKEAINGHASEPTSLCFIDLDGLKQINDTYGHDAGDAMIIKVVDTIRACIRKSDMICRWGGDEFIVLVRCGTAEAEKLMARAQAALDQSGTIGQHTYPLGFSYGVISLTDKPNLTTDMIISLADALMYEQKMKKRDREL